MADATDEYKVVLEETNAAGVPIAYACEYHTGANPLTDLPETQAEADVRQFFDLVFPCNTTDKTVAADYVAQELLVAAAETWRILPDGEGCLAPQKEYGSWLVGVATAEPAFLSDFGCQAETVDAARGECCQVVSLTMRFWPTGDFDAANLEEFVRDQLASSDGALFAPSLPLRTTPIDPVFAEPGGAGADLGTLPPDDGTGGAAGVAPVTGGEEAAREPSSDRKITVPGGFLMAALICAAVGVGVIVLRRYRQRRASEMAAKGGDDGTLEHGGPPSGDDEPFRVSVLSDDDDVLLNDDDYRNNPRLHSDIPNNANASFEEDDDDDNLDDAPPPKYAFDLSQSSFSNRNAVLGTYGFRGSPAGGGGGAAAPTTMQVVAPYPILDEQSSCNTNNNSVSECSEVDSWAQTDATVGSLEERLEEITAEI